MGTPNTPGRVIAALLGCLAWAGNLAPLVHAQPPPQRFQLADAVRLDEADSAIQADLRRVDALLAARQFEALLETLLRVSETAGAKVIRVAPDRAISLRDFCHLQISSLPAEGLALYRRQVDAIAEKAFRQALADRDERGLRRIVDQWFASSYGDDALASLAEMALESGQPQLARAEWLRLLETPLAVIAADTFESIRRDPVLAPYQAALLDRFYVRRGPRDAAAANLAWYVPNPNTWDDMTDEESAALVELAKRRRLPMTRLAYPGADLPRAAIRARIIWADILAAAMRHGADRDARFAEAADQIARFKKLHPTARGRIAGQDQHLASRLAELAADARSWPAPTVAQDHSTFAGQPSRNSAAITAARIALPAQLAAPAWRFSLGTPPQAIATPATDDSDPPRRLAEPATPFSFFPIVSGDLLFVATADTIRAWDLKTAKPAWTAASGHEPGVIFRDAERQARLAGRHRAVGVPRFTLSIHGDLLAARLGNPATSWPLGDDPPSSRLSGRIVLLDVGPRGQGKLARDVIEADGEGWSFDGVPLLDDSRLWVAMRKSDVRPQVHVACYDIRANPPRRLWRSLVASAETPAGGKLVEYTHNLLTRHGDTLYLNTNLGAVAALSADDGAPRWIYTYPRAKVGNLGRLHSTPHWFRDLVPCLYDQGKLFVAPADSPAIFALDADAGLVEWFTDHAPGAIHLLAVNQGHLIAAGERLYGLSVKTGQIVCRWPDESQSTPRGWGRGCVAGDTLLWPTREGLLAFDLPTSWKKRQWTPGGPPVPLAPHGAIGGNVLVAGSTLILTTTNPRQADVIAWRLDRK
jgi:outer membrane protein assembly factor BamB